MRPIPVRASYSHGSASRRRHSFAQAPVAKKVETPVESEENKTPQPKATVAAV
ncbi:MAG: hypothetical protein ACK5NC_10665 [Vibrio sp.]